jgi:hypothetical protein
MPSGPRPPIPPGIARVAISGTTLTHKWAQIFYLQITGSAVTVNDLQSISDEIATLWNTDVAPNLPGTVVLTNVTVVYIPSAGNELTYEGTYSHAGSSGNAQVADASACYVVQWKISAYYRGGHPRSYQTGPTAASVTNGSQISSGAVSAMASAWNSFRNSLNAFTTTNITGIVMGTLSFQTGNAWRTTPVFRAFTSVAVSNILGSQRRRIRS